MTSAVNAHLLAKFITEEVKKALFSIGDMKAPGPDGLHAAFYKRFRVMLENELITEVLQAVNSGTILSGWNETTIVLIPKIEKPIFFTQFRPISVCNVIYRVISKMLATRMKSILPEVVGEAQSAFVPGRLITDNILVAYEIIHRIKKARKQGLCAVKLDMHQAYYRIEWCFLEGIFLKLGFDYRCMNLIMACVRSVTYSIGFNSVETKHSPLPRVFGKVILEPLFVHSGCRRFIFYDTRCRGEGPY